MSVVGNGAYLNCYAVSLVLLIGLAVSSYVTTATVFCLPLGGRALILVSVRVSPSFGVASLEGDLRVVRYLLLRLTCQSLVLRPLSAYYTRRLVTTVPFPVICLHLPVGFATSTL